jgi:PAS domain-containing protein
MSHLVATLDQALEKQRLGQALQQAEERYRLVAENIADAVFLFDPDGQSLLSKVS